ncbi:MAG: T9SS type A sorting domain-containing protein [Ignavibacterium sp.]|nr:T9SS type A sorting domain-containing protein [Ignavibacterium sp.]
MNLHVVWEYVKGFFSEIYYKRSLNAGTNWSENIRLTNNSSSSEYPSVAVSGSEIHVAWYFKRSLDNGVNWSDDVRLTNNTENSYSPSIGVSNSNVYIVWIDSRTGNEGIYFKRSLDNGTNCSEDNKLTEVASSKLNSSIAVSGPNVHLVWREYRDNNYEIYYKHSLNNGTNWSEDVRLTNADAGSWNPSIAVSNSSLHVVWTDYRDAYTEIYYKLNPTGNVTGIEDTEFQIPTKFSLMQNYPNPFNPGTTISWQSPVGSHQTIKLFDVLGRELETIADGYYDAGLHSTLYPNGINSSLPSGVYFCRLKTENYSKIIKMLYLK